MLVVMVRLDLLNRRLMRGLGPGCHRRNVVRHVLLLRGMLLRVLVVMVRKMAMLSASPAVSVVLRCLHVIARPGIVVVSSAVTTVAVVPSNQRHRRRGSEYRHFVLLSC